MDVFPVTLRNKESTEDQFETELRTSWDLMLGLAYDHGWKPAGTLEPSDWRSMDYNNEFTCQYARYAGWHLPGSYDHNDTFRPDPSETWSGTYWTDQGQVVDAGRC